MNWLFVYNSTYVFLTSVYYFLLLSRLNLSSRLYYVFLTSFFSSLCSFSNKTRTFFKIIRADTCWLEQIFINKTMLFFFFSYVYGAYTVIFILIFSPLLHFPRSFLIHIYLYETTVGGFLYIYECVPVEKRVRAACCNRKF